MRRTLAASLVAAATFLSVSAVVGAQAQVSITPAAGGAADTFTVDGAGLPAGLALDVNFVAPEGTVYSTAAMNKVVVVDPTGNFEFSVTPATDFTGSNFGTWMVQVCASGTDNCVQTTFDING